MTTDAAKKEFIAQIMNDEKLKRSELPVVLGSNDQGGIIPVPAKQDDVVRNGEIVTKKININLGEGEGKLSLSCNLTKRSFIGKDGLQTFWSPVLHNITTDELFKYTAEVATLLKSLRDACLVAACTNTDLVNNPTPQPKCGIFLAQQLVGGLGGEHGAIKHFIEAAYPASGAASALNNWNLEADRTKIADQMGDVTLNKLATGLEALAEYYLKVKGNKTGSIIGAAKAEPIVKREETSKVSVVERASIKDKNYSDML